MSDISEFIFFSRQESSEEVTRYLTETRNRLREGLFQPNKRATMSDLLENSLLVPSNARANVTRSQFVDFSEACEQDTRTNIRPSNELDFTHQNYLGAKRHFPERSADWTGEFPVEKRRCSTPKRNAPRPAQDTPAPSHSMAQHGAMADISSVKTMKQNTTCVDTGVQTVFVEDSFDDSMAIAMETPLLESTGVQTDEVVDDKDGSSVLPVDQQVQTSLKVNKGHFV